MKSAKIYQYAKDNDYNIAVFTGGLLTKYTIYGVDFINPDTNSCSHYVAEWYKKAIQSDKKTLLFLDDFANANPTEMMILQQLLGDRKLGNYDLPVDKFIIVGATNRLGDNANVYNISSPILSRLILLEVQLNAEEYLEYSANNNHPSVHSFLYNRRWAISNDSSFLEANTVPGDVMGYGANSFNMVNPCPRTWSAVSDMLYKIGVNVLDDKYKHGFTQNVSGLIGSSLSNLFVRSLNSSLNIPSIEFLVSTCKDKSVNYVDHITSNYEAVSSIIFTIYQKVCSELIVYMELKNQGKLNKINVGKTSVRHKFEYEPISDLMFVLDKLSTTKFKTGGINTGSLITNVYDLLMSGDTQISQNYQMIVGCEELIKSYMNNKSIVESSIN